MRSVTLEQCRKAASGAGERRIANRVMVQLHHLERYGKGRNRDSEQTGDTTSQAMAKHPVNPRESVNIRRTPGKSFSLSPIAETTWGCCWAKVPSTRRECRLSGGINPSN
ncbi:MAG TPA: hypothetical protein V6C65_04750 [Allocoleopsis sp.]